MPFTPPLLNATGAPPAEGCYFVRWTTFPFKWLTHWDGTLRVEHVGSRLRVSGDLYAHTIRLLARSGPVNAPEPDPARIPILARADYRYYLEGKDFKVLAAAGGPAYELTLLRWTFDHRTGIFDPEDTFVVELAAATPPAGAPAGSQAWGGPVRRVPPHSGAYGVLDRARFDIWRLGDSFREASVELDAVSGCGAAPEAVDSAGRRHSLATGFATARWSVAYQVDSTTLAALPSGSQWSAADMHAAMIAHKQSVDYDKAWAYHVLVVPELARTPQGSVIAGIMYDDTMAPAADPNGVPREGVGVAAKYVFPATPRYQQVQGQEVEDVPVAQLRIFLHELGHAASLIHTNEPGEGGVDLTFMTPTGDVATLGLSAPPLFPDNAVMGFNEHCRHHLMHWPDPIVRPGGVHFPHSSGQHRRVPQAYDTVEEAASPEGLTLELEALEPAVPVGAPLPLRAVLRADGDGPAAPLLIDPIHRSLQLRVQGLDGLWKDMPPLVRAIEEQELRPLAAGQRRHASFWLYWSRLGFAFPAPGRYVVEASLVWWLDEIPAALSARAVVLVVPGEPAEAELAAALMSDDAGRYVGLDGADHLGRASEAASAAARSSSRLGRPWSLIEAMRLSRPSLYPAAWERGAVSRREAEPILAAERLEAALRGPAPCCQVSSVVAALGDRLPRPLRDRALEATAGFHP
jgi:hypothetical protein